MNNRCAHYRSVYGIGSRTLLRLGGAEHLDSMTEDARLTLINQYKRNGNRPGNTGVKNKYYYKLYKQRRNLDEGGCNGETEENQL